MGTKLLKSGWYDHITYVSKLKFSTNLFTFLSRKRKQTKFYWFFLVVGVNDAELWVNDLELWIWSSLEVFIINRSVSTSIAKTSPRIPPAALWKEKKKHKSKHLWFTKIHLMVSKIWQNERYTKHTRAGLRLNKALKEAYPTKYPVNMVRPTCKPIKWVYKKSKIFNDLCVIHFQEKSNRAKMLTETELVFVRRERLFDLFLGCYIFNKLSILLPLCYFSEL